MKTAIKLLLIGFLVLQFVAPFLVAVPCALYQVLTVGSVDEATLVNTILVPAQLSGQLLMVAYLAYGGYISRRRAAWSPVSGGYLLLCTVAMLAAAYAASVLADQMRWLPNWVEDSIALFCSSWGGVLAITLVGPVFEELLFRGAIMNALLKRFSPAWAILLSALLFSVFHLNPAQMPPAFLIGILFAWVYYSTGSLLPCIWMHVLNNAVSLYLIVNYPESEYLEDFIVGAPYWIGAAASVVVLALAVLAMRRQSLRLKRDSGDNRPVD